MNLQQEALALNMDLSEKEPAAFADLLGNNYYNIGNLEIFNLNFAKAREYFHLADSTYSLLPQNERIENLKQQFKNRSDFTESEEAVFTVLAEKANIFSLIPEPDSVKFHYQLAELEFEKLSKIDGGQNTTFTIIVMYRGLVELSKQIEEKYRYQKKYILYLEKLLEGSADNQIGKKLLQSAYVDIANSTILLGKFKEAEKAAEKSLALEAASIKALSKMAAALLYQGKFRKASEIYTSWKDKPYESDTFNLVGEFFLHDLESYEEAGITHPDLQKIRQLF